MQLTKFFRKCACWCLCAGYLLGISRGYLALWENDDPQPIYTFSLRADSLPIADQLALRQGIHLANQDELLALLQDYL